MKHRVQVGVPSPQPERQINGVPEACHSGGRREVGLRAMPLVIQEDFSDFEWDSIVDDHQLPPIPEGWYPVRIVTAEVRAVEGKGSTFRELEMAMRVLDGNAHAGRVILDEIIFNSAESSRRRRAIIWRKLGLVREGMKTVCITAEDLLGREIVVEVRTVSYPRRDGTTGFKSQVTFAGYGPISKLGAEDQGEQSGRRSLSAARH